MSRNALVATATGFVSLMLTIVGTAAVVQHQETQRLQSCVESGGAYVLTESGDGRECRREATQP